MNRTLLFLAVVAFLCLGYGLGACTREDGLPDPPYRALVPCHPVPDGGNSEQGDDPLACPDPPSPDDAPGPDGGSDGG